MQINITNITILTGRSGTDQVVLHTDLPSPYPAEVSDQPLTLDFNVAADKGLEYVQKNFPDVPTEVIDLSATREAGRPRFGQGRRDAHPPGMTSPEKFGDSDD